MKVIVHTKGIKGSRGKQEGEQADVMYSCVLEIDGMLIEKTTRVRVDHNADGLATVLAIFLPGEVEEVVHTNESWNALWRRDQ